MRPGGGMMGFLSHYSHLSLPLSPRSLSSSFSFFLGRSRPLAHRWGWSWSSGRGPGRGWPGENRQVILVSPELIRFPRVWEGLGVQLRVAEHFLEFGVVEGAVHGGVDFFPRWSGGRLGQWGGVRGGTGLRRRVFWLGWRGGLTSCREALWGGRRGCGACHGGSGCHTM